MIATRSKRSRSRVSSTRHPRTNPVAAIGIVKNDTKKSATPKGLARDAMTNSPRIMCVKHVVKPQPGHGKPVTIRNPHGGNPSCVCVPWPTGLGVRVIAVIITAVGTANRKNHPIRDVMRDWRAGSAAETSVTSGAYGLNPARQSTGSRQPGSRDPSQTQADVQLRGSVCSATPAPTGLFPPARWCAKCAWRHFSPVPRIPAIPPS